MSKKQWPMNPETGVHEDWLPEDHLDDNGNFIYLDGCNVAGKGIPRFLGYPRYKFDEKLTMGTGSYWHLEKIRLNKNRGTMYCTHTDSLEAGRKEYDKAAKERMFAGKRIKPTDVSGGSNF